ncbi:MAG: PDZ domain-containing protein [Planctomycetales bacterium]
MKRTRTAGLAAVALLGATFMMGGVVRAQDADVELEVPQTPGAEAEADVEAEARGRADANLQTGQFVQRSNGQLQFRNAEGRVVSQRLADDAVIVIDGRPAQWADVRQGDHVRFQLDPDQMVTRVTVVRDSAAGVAARDQAPQAGRREGVMLGVHITESPTTGVYVRDVMPGGPAERGGIAARDYILTINGEKIASPEEFDQKMANFKPGSEAKFDVWRNQQKQQVTVRFTEQDQALARGQLRQDQRVAQGQFQGRQERSSAFRPEDRGGAQARAWLGVQLQDAAPAREGEEVQPQQGVRISDIYPSGPAARYGLFEGDVIVRIADQEVTSADAAARLISQQQVGKAVPIAVRRGEQEQTIEVVLANRSDFFFEEDQPRQNGAFQDQQQQGRAHFGDFQSGTVPEHAMMLEQHRRFAEQHERMERMLAELQEEVRQLRQDLKLKNNANNNPNP